MSTLYLLSLVPMIAGMLAVWVSHAPEPKIARPIDPNFNPSNRNHQRWS